jgi:hypothetical protein
MNKLFLIKFKDEKGEERYIVNGAEGKPPSSKRINDATLFPTELHAAKRAYRLGLMYPNIEFTISSIDV